jgi:hypothetical protein
MARHDDDDWLGRKIERPKRHQERSKGDAITRSGE